MSIIALIIFLFTVGVSGLILYTTIKALRKSSLANKRDHLKLVDEQYEEVVVLKKQHKNIDKKEEEIKKFTNN